jgi:hypothetical protein
MSAEIRKRTTQLQALVREVEGWREEQDPGTPEWHTLVELAEQVQGLLTALPWTMQPTPTVDELVELIGL